MTGYLLISALVFGALGALELASAYQETLGDVAEREDLPQEQARLFASIQTLIGLVLVAMAIWSLALLIGGASAAKSD